METNKLLTLEDIEELDKIRFVGTSFEVRLNPCDYHALLATARAYWELKEKALVIEPGSVTLGEDNKPHRRTLEVIVEALKEAQGIHAETARSPEDIGRAIKSLEKHLE
jgi:hypothetical protein